MEWTAAVPTEPGFYWFRDSFGNEPEILRLSGDGVHVFGEADLAEIGDFSDGEWYGPLLPPQ